MNWLTRCKTSNLLFCAWCIKIWLKFYLPLILLYFINSPRTSSKLLLFLKKSVKSKKLKKIIQNGKSIYQAMQCGKKTHLKKARNYHSFCLFIWDVVYQFTHSTSVFFCILIVSKKPLENLFFKCCALPRHLNSPLTMIAKRVQRASHSSILWDVSTIDFPARRTFDTIFQRFRFAPGSMPVVGSSSNEEKR